ncbi:perforin-1.3 [Osmerus mordax]|uniref:perforin-1.3 n=1 Tax=Osmerus mordax TaxID=8014 RepID=UPI00351057EB
MPSLPLLLLLLLLLLLFTPPSGGCHSGTFTECHAAQFVPGHNLVGEGFDIVKMQTSGAYVVDVRNFMDGSGHKANCTLCHNRLMNQTQKLPLSVVDWRIKVLCRRSLSSKMFESSMSVVKESSTSTSVSWKVGLGLPGVGGLAVGGTHSKSSSFAQSHSRKDKYSFTSHEFKCKYYTFRLHSTPPLGKEFQEALKNLPTTIEPKSHKAYDHFLSIFGTHYIRRVDLGGRVHSTTAVRTCQASMNGLSTHSVSNCLGVEASAVIKGIKIKASTEYCKAQSKKLKTGLSFSGTFSDRVTEVQGGNGEVADLLFQPGKQSNYKKWLASLKTLPGMVSYQLSSLHTLVRNNPILESNLRTAIRGYIMRNAISTACPSGCSMGRRNKNCACSCSGHSRVNSNCCPTKPGIGRMNVTVVRATGLWGDYFSKTDGYVKVFYGKQGDATPVIWNNDFPVWNFKIHFGTVELGSRIPVKFEVWDRDNVWNDDRLGTASIIPTQGVNVSKRFKLKHGSLYVTMSVVCGPSLKGSLCIDYSPSPSSLDGLPDPDARAPGGDVGTSFQQGPAARNSTFL